MRPYRVVADSRDAAAWAAGRRACSITASEVSTLMGATPWRTPQQLLSEKLRPVVEQEAESETVGRKAQVFWGRALEEATLRGWRDWERLHGWPCWTRHNTLLLTSRDRPWFGATPDGLVRRYGVTAVVEVKRPKFFSLRKWQKEGMPEYYAWQLRAQMYVTGFRHGVLVGQVDDEPLTLPLEWLAGPERNMLDACDRFHHKLTAARAAQE